MKSNAFKFELSDEDFHEIESRRASYEAGTSKMYTVKEVKKKLLASLKRNENKVPKKK